MGRWLLGWRGIWLLTGVVATALGWLGARLTPDGAVRAISQSLSTPSAQRGEIAPAIKRRTGVLDVTFFVASDTHLGFDTPDTSGRDIVRNPVGIEVTNLKMIEAMNGLAGRPWPPEIGRAVHRPRGVIVTGDLTEDGGQQDWRLFVAMYGLTGREGPLHYPVYEAGGNHDRNRNWYVREQIAKRHGGRFYSFDFDDLHLVCLGEAPDETGLEFLATDLEHVARDVPVVLYLHYPLLGPYSDNWWSEGDYREQLYETIRGHNVVGIFHGHYHASGAYGWRGYDVYNVGSPKHAHHSFAAVHVTERQMVVASFNYDLGDWWWWHVKPINEGTGERRSWTRAAQGFFGAVVARNPLRPCDSRES